MTDTNAADSTKYETKNVRAIRGTEERAISKWEKEGWELVSRAQKPLHAEIVLRRPLPKRPWRLIAIGGGALVVVLAGVVVIGALGERGDQDDAGVPATAAAPPSPAASSTRGTTPPAPSVDEEPVADAVLTPQSDAELARVLEAGDSCGADVQAFADAHAGDTISFDASVGAINSHDGAATRYDLLINPGDFSETEARGPAFQFRDVNTTSDLNYSGAAPDTIGVGTNLGVTAEIVEYESSSCLFLLEPVETTVR